MKSPRHDKPIELPARDGPEPTPATLPHLNGFQRNPEPPAEPVLSHIEDLRAIREKNLALHIWCKPEEAAIEQIRATC